MAPAGSLARMRKQVLDRVARGEVSVVQACREAGWSRSRFYELRSRYLTYGEAGLLPKPRPPTRPDRRLPPPLVDQIVAYAINHPTEGPRSIAARTASPLASDTRSPLLRRVPSRSSARSLYMDERTVL